MKEKLLEVIAAARAREQELANGATEAPADPDGRWHAKDHLAHAAWWRERDGRLIAAVRIGSTPPPPVGSRESDGEQKQNELIYHEFRDRPLAEVRQFATSSWDGFRSAVEACSDEDLSRPHPYAANEMLWQTVLGIPYHTGEHLSYWYESSGDETHLESTQRWLRDIYAAVAPDAKSRATANYNLACYYAKRSRAEDALPLLREAFAGNEQLRQWGKSDSDLDSIREHPAIKELLA